MRKTLKTIIGIVAVFMVLMTFTNCESENFDATDKKVSVTNAKNWFEKNKPNLTVLGYTKTVDWDNATVTDGKGVKIIEVPLLLKDNMAVRGKDKSLTVHNRLLIVANEKGNYEVYQMLITTKKEAVIDEELNKRTADFYEHITVLDSKNQVVDFDPITGKSKPLANSKTAKAEESCTWLIEMYDDGSIRYVTLLFCSGGTLPIRVGSDGTGGGERDPSETEIVILGPKVKIVDINVYLKCFNLSQNAELIIYVDQPKPNSSDSWAGSIDDPDVGHTFIALQQGDTRKVFGYYPATKVNPYTSTSDSKAFGNDENHFFDVSISIPISSNQLVGIIGYCINAPNTYNLNTFNCTDFAIEIGKLGGLNLPNSYGTWPGGGGDNPGQLGQNIRNMQLPANASRQTTGANSASNKGTCN